MLGFIEKSKLAPMKQYLKSNLPKLYSLLARIWNIPEKLKRERKLRNRRRQLKEISSTLLNKYGYSVQAGPFKGMKIPQTKEFGSIHPSKLVGAYELEIYPFIDKIIKKSPETILNIGASSGYYTVGLALCLPKAKVYSYDIDPTPLSVCKNFVNYNDLTNVEYGELCSHETISSLNGEKALLFLDCEGAEIEILEPEKCKGLLNYDILVETHDHIIANISETLRKRFSNSHNIYEIEQKNRKVSDFPLLEHLSQKQKELALNEFRNPLGGWMYMEAKD